MAPLVISIDTAFNVFAVWREYNFISYTSAVNIKGQFFNENGTNQTDVFLIGHASSSAYTVKCKNFSKSFAVLYNDGNVLNLIRKYDLDNEYLFKNSFSNTSYTNPIQINIVEFNNQKTFITYNSQSQAIGFYANDNSRKVQTYNLHDYYSTNSFYNEFDQFNSTDIFNSKLVFTYQSNKNAMTGYDIWANVRELDNVNFAKEIFFKPTNDDVLYANFPNPFNSKTKIVYEIIAYHKVKLAVYDVLGREIKVLVDQNQEKGLYQIEFDASGLASGIYFYRLEAFNTIVKKMIILK